MPQLPWIDHIEQLPSTHLAWREPNGLLAAGGGIDPQSLLLAYGRGVFPWFNPGEPPLWWSPCPRWLLLPQNLQVNRTLRKAIQRQDWQLSCNRFFPQVLQHCAAPREGQEGTWLSEPLQDSLIALNQQGAAHSVELSLNGQLMGGFYGIKFGQAFLGESMFSLVSNASKIALALFIDQQPLGKIAMIDCQVYTEHLAALGAKPFSRIEFETLLQRSVGTSVHNENPAYRTS